MRFENSPAFEAEMAAHTKKREAAKRRCNRLYDAAVKKWIAAERGWLPMADCPFEALDDRYGFDGAILVTDGKDRALATVSQRFGRPIFWKVQPELVYRDMMPALVGGVVDPREDIPAWWWEWELTDEFGRMTYARGEETGKVEVGFVATMWTFLPALPRTD